MIMMFVLGAVLLGVIHSFEPDHIAAVAALSARVRNPVLAMLSGVLWGCAHGSVIVICAFVLYSYTFSFSPDVQAQFEIGVGVMLMLVGFKLIFNLFNSARSEHEHIRVTMSASLVAGVVHGLAGSGVALSLLFAAHPEYGVSAAIAFGVGNCIGMGTAAFFLGAAVQLLRTHLLKVASFVFQTIIASVAVAVGILKIVTGISN